MSFLLFVKKMIRDFFTIVAGTVICTVIFCRIFYPDISFDLDGMNTILLFALAGDLPTLIMYSSKDLSKRQYLFRSVIHFVVLETVLLTFAKCLHWIGSGFWQPVVFAALIAGVYALVWLVSWYAEVKTASQINERLKKRKEERKE
jgi:hypothetical protein